MKLTRTERWILSNQLKMLAILDPDQQDYYEATQKIIDNGYEYLYSDRIQFICPDDQTISREDSMLVLNILDMFRGITRSLERIEDKTGINVDRLRFDGFDGNEEGKYYDFAKFFCTEFDGVRFPEIGTGDDNFNSHFPVLDTYNRMLEVWDTCKDKFNLTKDELIQIEKATIHPDNR